MKRCQKIWAGPPPLIQTKSKRTATFSGCRPLDDLVLILCLLIFFITMIFLILCLKIILIFCLRMAETMTCASCQESITDRAMKAKDLVSSIRTSTHGKRTMDFKLKLKARGQQIYNFISTNLESSIEGKGKMRDFLKLEKHQLCETQIQPILFVS